MADVTLTAVVKDGYRMDVHPDVLHAYLADGWVIMETEQQAGGGPSLQDTTAESDPKQRSKRLR